MKTKKILSLLLTAVLGICLVACDKPQDDPQKTQENPADKTPNVSAEPTEAPTPEPTTVIAGTYSGIVRDGTPKKYFTLSFDDGITQDARIIELCKKYGIHCTFFINTDLFGARWDWVAEAVNKPGLSHQRFTKDEMLTGIYDGFDVESHSLHHPALSTMTAAQVTDEVQTDMDNIFELTNVKPCGFSYPGGANDSNTKEVRQILLDTTDVRFARTASATNGFKLPKNFMQWTPSAGIGNGNFLSLTKKFLKAECTDDMLFYVWGHGYELDQMDYWDEFEEMLKLLSEDKSIVFVSNAEFYQLFKDQIPSVVK